MSSLVDPIITYAREKHLSTHTLSRWRAWSEDDQAALLTLVHTLQPGENHLRDVLDWLEEIVLRDGGTVQAVLTRPEVCHPLKLKLGRNDKLKAVKEALRKIRYPRLSQLEEQLRTAVKTLDLGGQVRISFPPALEGDEVTVEIKVRNVQELRDSLARLQRRLDEGVLQQLFVLLDHV